MSIVTCQNLGTKEQVGFNIRNQWSPFYRKTFRTDRQSNARRHALGTPVTLQVNANPSQGVHVHVSNPTISQSHPDTANPRKGAGLPSLAERVRRAGGACQYGFDQHNVFHLDVRLPWVGWALSATMTSSRSPSA